MTENEIAKIIVDAAYHLHTDLGPGLLESVYEAMLSRELALRGLKVARQQPISFEYRGQRFDEGFRADLMIDDLGSVPRVQQKAGSW
jgi:GxxExxY protein